MTDSVQQQLDGALKAVLTSLQSGLDLAKEQIPILLQEKLTYTFYTDLFWVLIALTFSISAVIWAAHWHRKWIKVNTREDGIRKDYTQDENLVVAYAPAVVIWIISSISLCINLIEMIQISLAPRLYLMEWLVDLLKSRS